MKTLNDYFDKVYIINLERRNDRKDGYYLQNDNGDFILDHFGDKIWVKGFIEELETLCPKYEIFKAIDGNTLDIEIEKKDNLRFNKGAYALVLTTIKILEDALEKGYENILIFEDDIVVNPLFEVNVFEYMERQPKNWDLLFLGYTETGPIYNYNGKWLFLSSAMSCHAYAINKHMLKFYKNLLEKLNKPIDYYTNLIMMSKNNSYGATTLNGIKLIGQKDGISDLEGGFYATGFTR